MSSKKSKNYHDDLNISESLDPLDLDIVDPLDENINADLIKPFNANQCDLGIASLDHYCSMAFKDSDNVIHCLAMLNWANDTRVNDLKSCFWRMSPRSKLAEANRRKKRPSSRQ